jgi:uncharacterized membrane protein YkoI
MHRLRALLAPGLAAVLLSAAAPTLAQGVAMPPHPDINTTGFSGDADTLSNAVKTIEAASGGRVVEIRYNNVAGVPGYDYVVEKDSQVSFKRFSVPTGGMITLTEKTEPAWMLNWRQRQDVKVVNAAKVSLSDAIHTAEAEARAPAVAAGIAASASNPTSDVHAYNVAVLTQGKLRRVAVDADTGQPIEDPQALSEW